MEVILNDAEQRLVRYLAEKRYSNARDKGFVDCKQGDQSNQLTDLEGMGGELAFCKLFNVYPDLSILLDLKAEDCILPDGRKVDVKTTKYDSGRLVAVTWKTPKVDAFALMTGTFPEYKYRGMMSSKELLQEKRIGSLNGKSKGYLAEQHELMKEIP